MEMVMENVLKDTERLRQAILAGKLNETTRPESYDSLCPSCGGTRGYMLQAENTMIALLERWLDPNTIERVSIKETFTSICEVMLVVDEDAADGFRWHLHQHCIRINPKYEDWYCMEIPEFQKVLEDLGWRSLSTSPDDIPRYV